MNDELKHYGVIGMKWGVRKNPSRAFYKASKKANRLRKKVAKSDVKLAKKQAKFEKIGRRWAGWGYASQSAIRNTAKDVHRHTRKNAIRRRRSDKWEKAMTEAFSQTKVSQIDPNHLEVGKDYVDMLLKR